MQANKIPLVNVILLPASDQSMSANVGLNFYVGEDNYHILSIDYWSLLPAFTPWVNSLISSTHDGPSEGGSHQLVVIFLYWLLYCTMTINNGQ